MSAQEFEEWKVMFKHEQLSPAVDRFRQAQLVAAAFQGPVTRKGGKGWDAAQFMVPDPWAAPAAPGRRRVTGNAAQQMRALTRRGHS